MVIKPTKTAKSPWSTGGQPTVLAMPTFISLFVINPLPSEMLCLEIPFQPTLRLPQQGCQPIPPFGGQVLSGPYFQLRKDLACTLQLRNPCPPHWTHSSLTCPTATPLPEAFAVFVQRVRTQRAGTEALQAAKIPLHLREESRASEGMGPPPWVSLGL